MSITIKSIDTAGVSAFAQALVRTPSPSTQEGLVAALVAEEMRSVGFEVAVDRMGNVIGRMGAGEGKALLCDAHMDTVDVGDLSTWKRDPFAGEIHKGVLYGRGAADMKGGLAAMVYAGKALRDSGITLGGDLYVVGVVQEEPCEGVAIRHVIEEGGVRPDWVVVGEATNLQLSRGQRGRLECHITIHGRSCHASSPERGVNAIYEAARVVVGLELMASQLGQDSFLGRGSIAVTDIGSAAGSRNVLPDRCDLIVDRRLTVNETETKAIAELQRVISREGIQATVEVSEYREVSYTGYEVVARQHFPYWVTGEDDPLLSSAVGVIGDVLSFVPHVGRWDFSTDGVYTAGVAGIPTIGFGPGEERYAHTVEDQISLRDVEAAARVYAELAVRLLGRR
ncbi:MAG: YgeY family selenium metabolism-linked hydrolase [Anaerolineae bacterium]